MPDIGDPVARMTNTSLWLKKKRVCTLSVPTECSTSEGLWAVAPLHPPRRFGKSMRDTPWPSSSDTTT